MEKFKGGRNRIQRRTILTRVIHKYFNFFFREIPTIIPTSIFFFFFSKPIALKRERERDARRLFYEPTRVKCRALCLVLRSEDTVWTTKL